MVRTWKKVYHEISRTHRLCLQRIQKENDHELLFVAFVVIWHTSFAQIPAWINNHIPSKVWDEITNPFLNFNGCTVEV